MDLILLRRRNIASSEIDQGIVVVTRYGLTWHGWRNTTLFCTLLVLQAEGPIMWLLQLRLDESIFFLSFKSELVQWFDFLCGRSKAKHNTC